MGLFSKRSDFNFVQYFGVFLLFLAFFVWFVPFVEIKSNEIMLSDAINPNFEAWQISVYSGSLNWWKNLYVNTIIPVVGILITSGLVTISLPFIFHFENLALFKRFRNKYQPITLDDYFNSEDN